MNTKSLLAQHNIRVMAVTSGCARSLLASFQQRKLILNTSDAIYNLVLTDDLTQAIAALGHFYSVIHLE